MSTDGDICDFDELLNQAKAATPDCEFIVTQLDKMADRLDDNDTKTKDILTENQKTTLSQIALCLIKHDCQTDDPNMIMQRVSTSGHDGLLGAVSRFGAMDETIKILANDVEIRTFLDTRRPDLMWPIFDQLLTYLSSPDSDPAMNKLFEHYFDGLDRNIHTMHIVPEQFTVFGGFWNQANDDVKNQYLELVARASEQYVHFCKAHATPNTPLIEGTVSQVTELFGSNAQTTEEINATVQKIYGIGDIGEMAAEFGATLLKSYPFNTFKNDQVLRITTPLIGVISFSQAHVPELSESASVSEFSQILKNLGIMEAEQSFAFISPP